MKIHKRYQKNIAVGETVRCGLLEGYLPEENTTFLWRKVTCKNCLRFK